MTRKGSSSGRAANTLLALEDGDASAAACSGAEVQRVCAVEHGRQCALLGWDAAELAREFTARRAAQQEKGEETAEPGAQG